MITIPLSEIEREALRGLAESAWRAAVEGDQLDLIGHMSPDTLADDMISYDADIETFSDTHGYEFTKAALIEMLPDITPKRSF